VTAPTSPSRTRPGVSLVVSTVGRPEALRRLISSLVGAHDTAAIELVVVDQSVERRCIAVLEADPPPFPWTATTSSLGLSHGRNVGLRHAHGDLIAFPDDDCWYRPDTLTRVLARFACADQPDVVAGRALTAEGRPSLLRWAPTARRVTRTNYHRTTISFTLFVRRSLVIDAGGFDERLGVGASGWYGAGEESDLVLRLLERRAVAVYDPRVAVHHDDARMAPTPDLVDKMLRYGCGQGHLWRRHRISPPHVAYLLARKATGSVAHYVARRPMLARADVAYLRGCVAGLRDRPPAALATSRPVEGSRP
jgi:glycosyltransferase involved in cell wall biosynthesis